MKEPSNGHDICTSEERSPDGDLSPTSPVPSPNSDEGDVALGSPSLLRVKSFNAATDTRDASLLFRRWAEERANRAVLAQRAALAHGLRPLAYAATHQRPPRPLKDGLEGACQHKQWICANGHRSCVYSSVVEQSTADR